MRKKFDIKSLTLCFCIKTGLLNPISTKVPVVAFVVK